MRWGTSSRQRRERRRSRRACALAALLATAVLTALPAAAQVQDIALMRGEILDPMVLQNPADMDFGDITPGRPTAAWS
jgi:hypothetical protein